MADLIKLLAPVNCGPFMRNGIEYAVAEDGSVDVPAGLAAELAQHGFSVIRPSVAESRDDDDPNFAPVEDISTMRRNELFAFLKAKGVAVALPITNDELRGLATAAATAPASEPQPQPEPVPPASPVPEAATQEPNPVPEPDYGAGYTGQ